MSTDAVVKPPQESTKYINLLRSNIVGVTKTARRKNELVIFFTRDVCCDNKEGSLGGFALQALVW